MKHMSMALAGLCLLATGSALAANPSFRAVVEGNKVVVYSTSDKDIACYAMVTFSYRVGGERETRRFVCNTFARAEKDFRFCEREDEKFVDLKIESEVAGNCG